jgi:hypothetical protein
MNERVRIGRRRFVRLAAVAAAAAAWNPLTAAPAAAAAASPKKKSARSRAGAPSVRAEIESQKRQLETMLQVIRSFDLPAGSPPALVFRPLRPRKRP